MAELDEVEGRSCLGDEFDQSEPHSGWLGAGSPNSGTAGLPRRSGMDRVGRQKTSLPNQCDTQERCLRAISGQLDEQTLTVFMPVSASARVL